MARITWLAAVAATVLVLGGCGSGGGAGGGGGDGSTGGSPGASTPPTTPAATATPTPLEIAGAALLSGDEIPLPEPDGEVSPAGAYTAQGEQVNTPWRQFMLCSTAAMADEGPAPTPEPGAVAGAWSFGAAYTPDGSGYTQIDQYAIVYSDEAAAQAALDRARALDCDAAIATWAAPGQDWSVETGTVPADVDGFRLTATFTHDKGASRSDEVSTVMRSGDTIHYMRFNESGAGSHDGLLDEAYVDQLIDAAAASLTAATG